jgi:hypothetical protein
MFERLGMQDFRRTRDRTLELRGRRWGSLRSDVRVGLYCKGYLWINTRGGTRHVLLQRTLSSYHSQG